MLKAVQMLRRIIIGSSQERRKDIMAISLCMLLLMCRLVYSKELDLDCQNPTSITSLNYPGRYPKYSQEKWSISAPPGQRILVTFNEFSLDSAQSDNLRIVDMTDEHNVKTYYGKNMNLPTFLSVANNIRIYFTSGTEANEGFNVTLSCFKHESALVHIVNGTSPERGILEIRPSSDIDWRRVCSDGFQRNTAEVVCRELGYPGVQSILNNSGHCGEEGMCMRAPICSELVSRIQDCLDGSIQSSSGTCVSTSSVVLKCYKPGYKGCFNTEDTDLPTMFYANSTAGCVSSCQSDTNKTLALVDGHQCTCAALTTDNMPSDQGRCIHSADMPTRFQPQTPSTWKAVYSTSEGLCRKLDPVKNGEWDSNLTWFGSTVRLQCYEGYTVNGAESLQCVPGESPYHPVWNEPTPSCDKAPSKENQQKRAWRFVLIPVFIIVGTLIFMVVFRFVQQRKKLSTPEGVENEGATQEPLRENDPGTPRKTAQLTVEADYTEAPI